MNGRVTIRTLHLKTGGEAKLDIGFDKSANPVTADFWLLRVGRLAYRAGNRRDLCGFRPIEISSNRDFVESRFADFVHRLAFSQISMEIHDLRVLISRLAHELTT